MIGSVFRIGAWFLFILLLGSGCSVKMLYNNADRFARWAVNDYIDMTDAQEEYFDAEIDVLHYWHRTVELPLYADYLASLPKSLNGDVEQDDIQEIFDNFYSWWDVFEAKASPMVIEMMLSLSDDQLARLPERLSKDNEDFDEDEDERPIDEVQAEWAKGYADTMSRFSGRLNKEQNADLAAESVRYVPQFGLWADYRRRWQTDLLMLLNDKRDDAEIFAESYLALIARREDYYGEELTAVFAVNEVLAREVTAWMFNNLTPKQRDRFDTRVMEMVTVFRELSEDVPDEIPTGGGCLIRC